MHLETQIATVTITRTEEEEEEAEVEVVEMEGVEVVVVVEEVVREAEEGAEDAEEVVVVDEVVVETVLYHSVIPTVLPHLNLTYLHPLHYLRRHQPSRQVKL